MALISLFIVLAGLSSRCLVMGHPDNLTESGNPVVNSSDGYPNGQFIFLIPSPLQYSGVVLGFTAFFRNQARVRFQLWRGLNTTTLELLGELPYSPTSNMSQQQVFFSEQSLSASCVHLQPGDHMGVYLEGTPGAIAYTWDPERPNTFLQNMTGLPPVRIGDRLEFSPHLFPYKFSMSALVDLNVDEYTVVEGSENLVYCTPSTDIDMTSSPPVYLTPSAADICIVTKHLMLLIIVMTLNFMW